MKKYEGMFLVDTKEHKKDPGAIEEHIKGLLGKSGGEFIEFEKWDERRLAYEIKGSTNGTYYLSYFSGESDTVGKLNREIELSALVLRGMFLRIKQIPDQELRIQAPSVVEAESARSYRSDRPFRDDRPARDGKPAAAPAEAKVVDTPPPASETPAPAADAPAADAPAADAPAADAPVADAPVADAPVADAPAADAPAADAPAADALKPEGEEPEKSE